MANNDIRWYIRLNLAREKDLLVKHSDLYHGLLIDAHILETYPKAITGFLFKLGEKPFIIDPITYKFSIYEFVEKNWYSKLLEAYLEGIIEEKECLLPDDFTDEHDLEIFVGRVLRYQENIVEEVLEDLGLFGLTGKLKPEIILAPYFVISSPRDKWFDMNIKCLEIAKNKKGDSKLYGVITLEKRLLFNDVFIDSVVEKYNIEGVDGYFVWITNFREEVVDAEYLKKFIEFCRKLLELGKPIINFYGGFFSLALSSLHVLNGFTHAPCYAEFRDPYSEGGPLPVRYYFDDFHNKILPTDAEDICTLAEKEEIDIGGCDCEVCEKYDNIGEINLMDATEHYLLARANELENMLNSDPNTIIKSNNKTMENMKKIDKIGKYKPFYQHLARWNNALVDSF